MLSQIHFILNDENIRADEPVGLLVLDFLRRRQKFTGTKEGCKEGDCGACMVLVGELSDGHLNYKPITSCLIPLGELHGKHLVTIEGLNTDQLSPVQKAIVDEGGSQCGFCTPGIVVSLTGYLMQSDYSLDDDGIKYALGGNLCRCTGYSSLKRAGKHLVKQFGNGANNSEPTNNDTIFDELIRQNVLPQYFKTVPERLRNISSLKTPAVEKPDYFVAGGTDMYVQKGELLPDSKVRALNLHPEIKGIKVENNEVRVGAITTFEEFANHPEINKIIPEMQTYNLFNASWQIRNRATLGGNIINASPIGDMTALLLVLNSTLVLQGEKSRRVPLKSFFKEYKILDKEPSEILTEIVFPVSASNTEIHFEKISKRKTLDIAAVNSAIKIKITKQVIEQIELSMGGVAPIPLYMQATCDYLQGLPVNPETIQAAINIALSEISPISDIRGSADYKRLLVRQILIAHFTKLYPKIVNVKSFYEVN